MDYFTSRYISASALLPSKLRTAALRLDDDSQTAAEEFRLRAGRPLSVLLPDGERSLDTAPVTADDLLETAARAAGGSLHSVAGELSDGFITARGGHRLGLCGRAVLEDGRCRTIRDFSSANLRIAKEVRGAADDVFSEVCGDRVYSTLILSPPGGGKTTLLRDLVRRVSGSGVRVLVADERGELSACVDGTHSFDLGRCTDVMTGAPKAFAAMAMLRSMDPQVIALDEITDPADFDAVQRIVGCGVAVFATVHAADPDELRRRAGSAALMPVFERFVVIRRQGVRRTVTVLSP